MPTTKSPLNEAQRSILHLFDRKMTKKQTQDLKIKLVEFLDELLQKELDKVIQAKALTPQKIAEMGNWENRTEYLKEIRKMTKP